MNQTQYILTYSEESAIKAGGGLFINEGGPYDCRIIEAEYITAGTGSSGLQFSVTSKDGLKGNYIQVYYAKSDNSLIAGGKSILDAMMGILGLEGLSYIKRNGKNICPELSGKNIGLFLQKRLYLNSKKEEKYSMEIRAPFDIQSRKTLKEMKSNSPAKSIEHWESNYKDIDDRGNAATHSSPQGHNQFPNNGSSNQDFNQFDDIPGDF